MGCNYMQGRKDRDLKMTEIKRKRRKIAKEPCCTIPAVCPLISDVPPLKYPVNHSESLPVDSQ